MATLTTSYQLLTEKRLLTVSYGNIDLRVYGKYNSQDTSACTSSVSLKVALFIGGSNYLTSSYNGNFIGQFNDAYSSGMTTLRAGEHTLAEITKTIYHNTSSGEGGFNIGATFVSSAPVGWQATSTDQVYCGLPTIPRYATVTQSLSSKTESSITMRWNSNSTIDHVWYSFNDGGSWVDAGSVNSTSGSYTINGLVGNSTYKIKTRVRRKDSQLTTDSSTTDVTTYGNPYASLSPFIVGNKAEIAVYNPLNRSLTITVRNSLNEIVDSFTTSINGKFYNKLNDTNSIDKLYKGSPNSQKGNLTITTVSSVGTYTSKYESIYTIPNTPPDFSGFEYYDGDSLTTGITGDNLVIVKNKSNLVVKIPSANKMVAKRYATPDRYEISCSNRSTSVRYNDNDLEATLGTINSDGLMNIVVTAYDSRGFSKQITKTIDVVNYTNIIQKNGLYRINNFENETKLLMEGTFSLVEVNGAAKNTVLKAKARYKTGEEAYSTWYELIPKIDGNKYTCDLLTFDLDNQKSFSFEIIATDKFGDSEPVVMSVDQGIPIVFINADKQNMGLGCINEHETGSFKATGNIYLPSDNPVLDYEIVDTW